MYATTDIWPYLIWPYSDPINYFFIGYIDKLSFSLKLHVIKRAPTEGIYQ